MYNLCFVTYYNLKLEMIYSLWDFLTDFVTFFICNCGWR